MRNVLFLTIQQAYRRKVVSDAQNIILENTRYQRLIRQL